jgi:hypothetical protein
MANILSMLELNCTTTTYTTTTTTTVIIIIIIIIIIHIPYFTAVWLVLKNYGSY